MFKVLYGILGNVVDVTDICLSLKNNNIIVIPHTDGARARLFGDHIPGVLKTLYIIHNNGSVEYDYKYTITINIDNGLVTSNNEHDVDQLTINKLYKIQSNLTLKYGSFNEEFPEQKMATRYLKGYENVLEIGGNIGRNSLIIGSILKDNGNLVTMECDEGIAKQLEENRNLNNLNFFIENSALSKRRLIQCGWDTIPSDVLFEGYKEVKTINFDDLKAKYNINFDTLVLDCEGAFYYILVDMPEILNNINLIIMENDYHNIFNKTHVDNVLLGNGFYRDYVESGGWGPCEQFFFEVWKK